MLKIGEIVCTEHGIGTVIGYDYIRFVVEFPEPPINFDGHSLGFSKLSYFDREVKIAGEDKTPKIYDQAKRNTFNKYSSTYCGSAHP